MVVHKVSKPVSILVNSAGVHIFNDGRMGTIKMSKKRTAAQKQTLIYVQDMLRELTALCRADQLKESAYFLQMAYIQVSDDVRESQAHQGPMVTEQSEPRLAQ